MAILCGSSRCIGAQVGNTSRSDEPTSPILPSMGSLLFIATGGHPLFDTILRSPNADRASPTSANQRRIPYSRPQHLSYPSTPVLIRLGTITAIRAGLLLPAPYDTTTRALCCCGKLSSWSSSPQFVQRHPRGLPLVLTLAATGLCTPEAW